MTELIAALAKLAGLLEDAVHGADRAEVGAFVQRGGKDLGGGLSRKRCELRTSRPPGVRQAPRRGAGSVEARVELSA